nr:uncharacterized protein LOC113826256 isoform X3 [Penaeus vannamei]
MPLLLYGHCLDLTIVSADFPKPIFAVTHANSVHSKCLLRRCRPPPIPRPTSYIISGTSSCPRHMLQDARPMLRGCRQNGVFVVVAGGFLHKILLAMGWTTPALRRGNSM